ncbi:Pfam:DUF1763 [Aspergillus sp. HF37]|nr:Pfam:DUF1763 [Aspergillus sp. HF37]
MDQRAVVSAYRNLYRQSLRAVRYSTPARHVLVRTLRSAFRSTPPKEFDPSKVSNTLRFLERAADVTGIEHKIVKKLVMVRYWQQPQVNKDFRVLRVIGLDSQEVAVRNDALDQFNLTLMLLNESLGTCLR